MNILNKLALHTLLACIFTQASPVQAQNNGESDTETPQNYDELASITRTDRTAYIDPNTGELTSTPEETNSKLSIASVSQSSLPAVEMLYHANGTVQAKLNGRFRSQVVAQLGCDGKVILTHSESNTIDAIDCGESE